MLLVCVPPAANNISGEQVGQLRLVPNVPHLRFTGRVRESLHSSIAAMGMMIEGLPWPISRHAGDNDPQLKQAKAQRDLRLLELDAQTHGQTEEILVALGDCLSTVGDVAGAVACYRKVLQTTQAGLRPQRQAYYGLLTALDGDLQYRPQQLAICLEALERFPVDAQMLCAMGGYMQAQDRLDVAVRAYRTAFEYGQVDPELWHVPDIFDIAAACLANAQLLLGEDAGAQIALERGIDRNPSSQRLRRQLIELHIKHDRRQEALAQFDALPTDVPQREALRSAIRGACLAARENWTPALAYLQTAFRAGLRDVLCLRWLARALHGLGDTAGLDEVLAAWQQSAPHSSELARWQAELQTGSAATASTTNAAESRRIDSAEVTANGSVPAPNFAKAGRINVYGAVD
jgi:tetratricopeptide (TPR) repeat protein